QPASPLLAASRLPASPGVSTRPPGSGWTSLSCRCRGCRRSSTVCGSPTSPTSPSGTPPRGRTLPGAPPEIVGRRIPPPAYFHFGYPSPGTHAVERAAEWVAERQPDLVLLTG